MINLFYIYTLYIIVAFGLKKLSLFQFMGPPIPFPTSTVGKPVSIPGGGGLLDTNTKVWCRQCCGSESVFRSFLDPDPYSEY